MKPIDTLFILTTIISTTLFYNKYIELKNKTESTENILNELIDLHVKIEVLVKIMAMKLPIKGEKWQMDIFKETFEIVNEKFNGNGSDESDEED